MTFKAKAVTPIADKLRARLNPYYSDARAFAEAVDSVLVVLAAKLLLSVGEERGLTNSSILSVCAVLMDNMVTMPNREAN